MNETSGYVNKIRLWSQHNYLNFRIKLYIYLFLLTAAISQINKNIKKKVAAYY